MIRIYGVLMTMTRVGKNCCLIYTDLHLNCSAVIQSFAFFNYFKCSLHSGAAEEKKISLFQHSHSASIRNYHGGCGGGVGRGVDELIADHRQLTGRDSALSPVMAQQDNNDN